MSKRAQLPRFRDPEVLVFEDDAPELHRLRKTTENDVYSTNIILTAVHVMPLLSQVMPSLYPFDIRPGASHGSWID